jgi:hypothetical protein
METSAKIRRKILRERGVCLEKHTRKPLTIDQQPTPYQKSNLMKLIELKHQESIENLIFKGTIYEVGKKLGVSPSAISKWRTLISKAKEKEFWSNFKEEG